MKKERLAGILISAGFGLAIALFAYRFITDPEPRQQREQEEGVVLQARAILHDYVALGGTLEIIDPVAPSRKIGKVYIYPTDNGWQVSGHYQRDGEQRWHPWLMTFRPGTTLSSLEVRDRHPAVVAAAANDPRFTAKP